MRWSSAASRAQRRCMRLPYLISLLVLTGCHTPGTLGTATGTPQAPPTTGAAAVDAWLAQGFYTMWHCETSPHPSRSPSPHGQNRICSNELLSGGGAGEFPVDSSAVKELIDGGNVIGHAVYRHVRSGTTGDTWFWYEKINDSVGAIGLGDTGTPHDSCVNCHKGAGSDSNHSGHDFVYTQVK